MFAHSAVTNVICASFILIAALAISIYAINCMPANDISSELKNRAVGNDGKIHVKYGFFDSNIDNESKLQLMDGRTFPRARQN